MTIGGVPPKFMNHGLVSSGVDIKINSVIFFDATIHP